MFLLGPIFPAGGCQVTSSFVRKIAAMPLAFSFALLSALSPALACTRVVYLGDDDIVITARSLDWAEDMRSNLWVFPRGIKRDGNAGANSMSWTSKYGSLITSGYDIGTADGINEKGLSANALYLAESDYGKPQDGKKNLSISTWTQYVLDNYATTQEVVDGLSKEEFVVICPVLPNGVPASLHLAVTDRSGDSAVFEYVKGKLVVHHGRDFRVMTNSPTFDQQQALNTYWRKVGGDIFLPGTTKAADRFARASYYIDSCKKTADNKLALAEIFGMIRAVSVPLGIAAPPNEPNIAPTRWRIVADQKKGVYYFDSASQPSIFWVDLAKLDLKDGAAVKKLDLQNGKTLAGEVSAQFEKAEPFVFLSGAGK